MNSACGGEPSSGRYNKLYKFEGELAQTEALLHSECHKIKLNPWLTKSISQVLIFSKVTALTS